MNTKYIYGIGTAIAAVAVVLFFQKQNKEPEPDNLELAGVPDQLEKEKEKLEQLENAKMVSEGSQFGVKYYNEVKNEEKEMKEI